MGSNNVGSIEYDDRGRCERTVRALLRRLLVKDFSDKGLPRDSDMYRPTQYSELLKVMNDVTVPNIPRQISVSEETDAKINDNFLLEDPCPLEMARLSISAVITACTGFSLVELFYRQP